MTNDIPAAFGFLHASSSKIADGRKNRQGRIVRKTLVTQVLFASYSGTIACEAGTSTSSVLLGGGISTSNR